MQLLELLLFLLLPLLLLHGLLHVLELLLGWKHHVVLELEVQGRGLQQVL
jgi:hypothetical protein